MVNIESLVQQARMLKTWQEIIHFIRGKVLTELTSSSQVSEFIAVLVRKTTKQDNWEMAIKIAIEMKDTDVWDTFTRELQIIAGKSKHPNWLYSIVKHFSRYVKVDNYNLKNVMSVIVKAGWPKLYIDYVAKRVELEDSYRAVADILLHVPPSALKLFIREFNDWEFINHLYYGKLSLPVEISMLSQSLQQVKNTNLKNFTAFEFDWLMKNHPEPFKNIDVITSACAAHAVKRTYETTTLLTNFIMAGEFQNDSKIAWLLGMYAEEDTNKNDTLNNALYDLTGEELYISEDAKDIFLF